MLIFANLLFITSMFVGPNIALAESDELLCVNGASPLNRDLIESFNENRDPLKVAFLEYQKTTYPYSQAILPPPSNCEPNAVFKKQLGFFGELADKFSGIFDTKFDQVNPQDLALKARLEIEKAKELNRPKPFQIKKDCVKASLQRKAGREEYVCKPDAQRALRVGIAAGKSAQCYNEELVDYIHFALNQAIDCLSQDNAIDSRNILKKMNAETGFNFSVCWRGGCGMSQITSPAMKELSTDIGNGKYILEGVTKSIKKSCEPFKHIAERDLAKPPKIYKTCDWVSPGDGLARNLIYGIGYHVHMRDTQITPALNKLAPQMVQDKDVINALTSMSYGREGIKGVKGLLRRNRISKTTPPSKLRDIIESDSRYLSETQKKQKELLCLQKGHSFGRNSQCSVTTFSDEEMAGNSCVSEP
ncbi:MAG: hypothetical protein IPM97_06685 [Bdellovibrionaceae bacterium]|nr:hypothetical protein [Pseudobdellovibrionaceae bacterium]